MSGDVIAAAELEARRRIAATGYPEEPGNCIAFKTAVYEINYGDTTAICPLCGDLPETHEDDPNEALNPWPGPRPA